MVSNRSLLLVLYSFQINSICINIKVLCTTPLLMAPCFLIFLPRISLSVTVIKCFCYLFCKIFPSDSIHIQVTLCPSSPPPHADAYKLRPEGSLGPLWPQATSLFEPHMLVAGWHTETSPFLIPTVISEHSSSFISKSLESIKSQAALSLQVFWFLLSTAGRTRLFPFVGFYFSGLE